MGGGATQPARSFRAAPAFTVIREAGTWSRIPAGTAAAARSARTEIEPRRMERCRTSSPDLAGRRPDRVELPSAPIESRPSGRASPMGSWPPAMWIRASSCCNSSVRVVLGPGGSPSEPVRRSSSRNGGGNCHPFWGHVQVLDPPLFPTEGERNDRTGTSGGSRRRR